MDKIAVLIPCYNEEKTIEKVVRDAKAALPEAVIYVYNNNILLSKVRQFCPFLENFPFDEDEPGCQYKTFGNGRSTYCPPDGIHSHTHVHQQ